ncbi:MAG: WYL domain-containing protein [Aquiluna sp.]|nr:WYL domain-containing protein [Aquiluna sp.]
MAAPVIGLSKNDIYASISSYLDQESDFARNKMFERDKKSLREMGVQLEVIESSSFEETDTSRYRISKDSFAWPSGFQLTGEHLRLLELAAKAWNSQVLAKPAQSGLIRLRSLGLVEASRELSLVTPRLLARHASFAPLADAIDAGKLVTFSYRKPDGATSIREVTPLKLRFIEGQWVLLAKQVDQIKNFMLRRIISKVEISELDGKITRQDEVNLVEEELVTFVSNNRARLIVTKGTEAWWHFGAKEEQEVVIHFMDEALLAEDLMEYGADISVLEPLSLRLRVENGLNRVLESHA